MKNQQIIIPILVAVVVGAGAFFGGMKYQQTKSPGFGSNRQFMMGQGNFGMRQGMNGGMRGNFSGGAVIGEILNMDDKSLTVKLPDGSSKIVLMPDNVTVSKTDTGSKTDLKTGDRVGVFGMTNQDGSVTAQNIQLNPMFRMGMMGSPMPDSAPQ